MVAAVTLAGDSLTEDEILEWADDELAAYKRPRDVVLEALPVTDMGKLDRERLEDAIVD